MAEPLTRGDKALMGLFVLFAPVLLVQWLLTEGLWVTVIVGGAIVAILAEAGVF